MLGEIAALSAACCWAVGSHLFGLIGRRGDVPAGAMNLGKCLTGVTLFTLTGWALTGQPLPVMSAEAFGWLAASGFVGLALGDGAYFRAILSMGVRRSLLFLSTAPVFTAVGGALWLREGLGLRDVLGILVVVVGVAVVVHEQQPGEDGRRLSAGGILFGFGAAIGQAAGSLMARAAMAEGVSALDAAIVRLPVGLLGILVISTFTGQIGVITRVLRRPRLFGAIALAASIGTYAGVWLSQVAIGHASSTAIAATLLATPPIFALPLGRWLNAERITPRAIGGTLAACVGLALLTLGQR